MRRSCIGRGYSQQEYHDAASQDKYWFCSGKHRIDFINDPKSYKEFPGKHLSP